MARKSKHRRLEEGYNLERQLTEANLTTSWEYRFITSMIEQMERGRYPSKKQRARFDDIIETGVPQPKGDAKLLAQIDGAIDHWSGNPDRDWDAGVLRDLRRNVFNDWALSDKQKGLLDKLLQRCEDDKAGLNDFSPTDEQVDDMRLLVQLYEGYSPQWQFERPALGKAVKRVCRYLSGEGTIEQYHYDKLMKGMGSRLKKYRNARFKKGDLSQLKLWQDNPGVDTVIICVSDVYINDKGAIVNDWMIPNGGTSTLQQDCLPKRLKK